MTRLPMSVRCGAYAEQIPTLRLAEFDGARHDILNESVHREVAAAIVDFVDEQAQNRT
jgi:alpha-beta hydrolase superfamily lysophospholipase